MASSKEEERDLYEILGVSKEASTEDIKIAYKKLALQWHPDRNLNNKQQAEQKFQEISNAFAILSDPSKRKNYDNGIPEEFEGFTEFSDDPEVRREQFEEFLREVDKMGQASEEHWKQDLKQFGKFIDEKHGMLGEDLKIYYILIPAIGDKLTKSNHPLFDQKNIMLRTEIISRLFYNNYETNNNILVFQTREDAAKAGELYHDGQINDDGKDVIIECLLKPENLIEAHFITQEGNNASSKLPRNTKAFKKQPLGSDFFLGNVKKIEFSACLYGKSKIHDNKIINIPTQQVKQFQDLVDNLKGANWASVTGMNLKGKTQPTRISQIISILDGISDENASEKLSSLSEKFKTSKKGTFWSKSELKNIYSICIDADKNPDDFLNKMTQALRNLTGAKTDFQISPASQK